MLKKMTEFLKNQFFHSFSGNSYPMNSILSYVGSYIPLHFQNYLLQLMMLDNLFGNFVFCLAGMKKKLCLKISAVIDSMSTFWR